MQRPLPGSDWFLDNSSFTRGRGACPELIESQATRCGTFPGRQWMPSLTNIGDLSWPPAAPDVARDKGFLYLGERERC